LSDLAAHIGQSLEPEQRKHNGSAPHTIFCAYSYVDIQDRFSYSPRKKKEFLSIKTTLNILLLLELKGRISQLPGKTFIRKEQ